MLVIMRLLRLRDLSICALILCACSGSGVTGSESAPGLSATIHTAHGVINYAGSGVFTYDSDPRSGGFDRFQLVSKGLGRSAGQSISLYRYGAGLPSVGSYQLAPVDREHPVGFVAYYHTRTSSTLDSYVSLSGTVTVTAASSDRVYGTLKLTVAQYCSTGTDTSSWCLLPTQVDATHTIEIVGTFVATPHLESGGIEL